MDLPINEEFTEKLPLNLRKRFSIIRELGDGSSGKVFLAIDKKHGDFTVALKVLKDTRQVGTIAQRRFIDELKTLKKIEHPNLVEAYELVSEGSHLAFTMEFVEGTNLHQMVFSSNPPSPEILDQIFAQILSALSALHKAGVAHRDIKLENVLVREDGLAKLSDLGLLRPLFTKGVTQTGILLGTTHYLPPEYVKHSLYTPRSDLYAVGLMLYEALTRRRWLDKRDEREALQYLCEKDFVFPKLALEGLPIKYKKILMIALDPNPDRRFRDAEEMRRAVLSETGDPEPTTKVHLREHLTVALAIEARRKRLAERRRSRQMKVLLHSLMLIVLLIVTIGLPANFDIP